jgi:peptide/nickel transport system substrate-binding protein
MKKRKLSIDIINDNVDEPLTWHDRATLADAVDDFRELRITRRSLVNRAAVFGLSLPAFSAILAESTANPAAAAADMHRAAQTKLRIGVSADADTVDPQAFKDVPGYYMLANVYDQLIDLKAHRQGDLLIANAAQPVGMIAKSMTISKDLRTVTFKLNPNAKFQDGSPITVEDVVYTMSRGVLGTQYTNTLMKMLTLTSVKNIKTPDKQTVVFKLDKPDPMTARLLSLQVLSIQSAKVSKAHSTKKDKWANDYWRSHVFANGPYTLQSWTRGVGWDLEPNANYYQRGVLKNGGLGFRVISDAQQRLGLLKSGSLDVAFDVSAQDAVALRTGGGKAKLISAPSPWNYMLVFTNTVKPFDNKQVRQALSYAVPYDAIVKNVMHGLARPSKGIIVPGMPTSDPSFWKYNTDLSKAKQMLAAAGFPNGFQTSIDVLIGAPEDQQAATLIQANFQQIGVTTQINLLDATQYQANFNNASSPMQMAEFFSWVDDPFYHMYWNMLSTNTFTNSARYSNPAVDKLILAGIYEANAAKRAAMSRQAQQLIVDDAPWAFLYARDFFALVASNLQDFPLWPDQNPRFYRTYLT